MAPNTRLEYEVRAAIEKDHKPIRLSLDSWLHTQKSHCWQVSVTLMWFWQPWVARGVKWAVGTAWYCLYWCPPVESWFDVMHLFLLRDACSTSSHRMWMFVLAMTPVKSVPGAFMACCHKQQSCFREKSPKICRSPDHHGEIQSLSGHSFGFRTCNFLFLVYSECQF